MSVSRCACYCSTAVALWWCAILPLWPRTMGAVCHRRGFPFLLPHNILAYGVKIAAIVVVVVAVVVACNHVQAAILTSSFGVLQSGLRTEWCRDHVSPLSHACV